MSEAHLIECTTTFGSQEDAVACAEALVARRLAGCVQVSGPVESIYRWEGKIHRDFEWKLTIKTVSSRQADLMSAIRSLHSYSEPEIIILPIIGASDGYAKWLIEQTTFSGE